MPRALQVGLDWMKFGTPYRAGGLEDQPLHLWRDVRSALNTYQAIHNWRSGQQLDAVGQQKFYSANKDLVKFMEYIWSLQDAFDG
jgi:hypothetical protein